MTHATIGAPPTKTTEVQQLAEFVLRADWESMSGEARDKIKMRVLDALACAFGALNEEPVRSVRRYIEEFGGRPVSTMFGGRRTPPDRAALYNGFAVRYLDFNDCCIRPAATGHPSDNLGAVLAASEYAGRDGRTFLTALAVAYQIQSRLSDVANVTSRGFDNCAQLAYSAAAGAARALGLGLDETANAIAIAGTAFVSLRVSRAGLVSNWKGLAAPQTAAGALQSALLAREGITGPSEVFEGKYGFKEALSGPYTIDWRGESLEAVTETEVKPFHIAGVGSQAAIDASLELRQEAPLDASTIDRVEIELPTSIYRIVGGGDYGDRQIVRTKEDADKSTPWLVGVALLDGAVGLEQYRLERILAPDIQSLLARTEARPSAELDRAQRGESGATVRVYLKDGTMRERSKADFRGSRTLPVGWDETIAKFNTMAAQVASTDLSARIVEAVQKLETLPVNELCALVSQVQIEGEDPSSTPRGTSAGPSEDRRAQG